MARQVSSAVDDAPDDDAPACGLGFVHDDPRPDREGAWLPIKIVAYTADARHVRDEVEGLVNASKNRLGALYPAVARDPIEQQIEIELRIESEDDPFLGHGGRLRLLARVVAFPAIGDDVVDGARRLHAFAHFLA